MVIIPLEACVLEKMLITHVRLHSQKPQLDQQQFPESSRFGDSVNFSKLFSSEVLICYSTIFFWHCTRRAALSHLPSSIVVAIVNEVHQPSIGNVSAPRGYDSCIMYDKCATIKLCVPGSRKTIPMNVFTSI